jgi:hypothetical protein
MVEGEVSVEKRDNGSGIAVATNINTVNFQRVAGLFSNKN